MGAAIVTEVWGQRYIVLASKQVVDPKKEENLDDLMHEVTEGLHWVGVGILVILRAAVLAPRLVTARYLNGEIVCAAGVRTAQDGFFSDSNNDGGIANALHFPDGAPVPLDQAM